MIDRHQWNSRSSHCFLWVTNVSWEVKSMPLEGHAAKKQEFIATLFCSGTVCNHKFFISRILQRMVCLHKYIRQGTSISFNSQFVSAQQMPMADLIGLFNMQLRRHNARCREQRRSDWTLRTADAYSCRTHPNETPLIARTRRARSRQSERLLWPSAVEFSSYG